MLSTAPLLVMRDIDKRFLGVHALAGASLEVAPGEIMALVGQNGAGKSTLIKVLTGAYPKDGGSIALAGEPIDFASPQEAQRGGVDRLAGERDRAAVFGIGAGQHLDEGRFAGAILADKRHDLAGRDFEARPRKRVDS